ncbi:MAG: MerR family transcriptional regulator [Sphingomicrobium sp.]
MAARHKEPGALLTIGELSTELGVAQHILRYWETRFAQLRPMQRAGNRRYYRPADVALARRIHRMLGEEGYTVRGVQKLLGSKTAVAEVAAAEPAPVQAPVEEIPAQMPAAAPEPSYAEPAVPSVDVFRLIAIRNRLSAAIGD